MSANENGRDSCGVQPVKTISQSTDNADFNADRYATLVIAKLEQAGHHVSRLENNGFLASRWNMTLHCPTLENLAQFAKQVGAMQ
jgi:hypothetical protein